MAIAMPEAKMSRPTIVVALLLCTLQAGCVSRARREVVGAVRGASGKVVILESPPSLAHFRGLSVDSIEIAAGLEVPSEIPAMVRQAYLDAGADLGLSPGGSPTLQVSGEIIHYETAGTIDHAIGPLEEIIVRTRLRESGSEQGLGEANLVGRSKTTTTSGRHNLAKGAGKALKKWLKKSGLDPQEDD